MPEHPKLDQLHRHIIRSAEVSPGHLGVVSHVGALVVRDTIKLNKHPSAREGSPEAADVKNKTEAQKWKEWMALSHQSYC